jgi:glycosyltransferase involved in cell wall biosynthesis
MKILIIGPFPDPITGNSLANQIIYENLPKYNEDVQVDNINTSYSCLKENLGKLNFSKVWHYFKQYVEIHKVLKCDKLYYTSGQTFYGVLKYFPYLLLAKLFRKEIIVHIHGNFLHKEFEALRGIKQYVFKKTLTLCDKGIVLSKSLRKNLSPFLKESQIFELENFVEDIILDHQFYKDFNKLRIIYLSNLMTEKGIFYLLEALTILSEMDVDFDAKIAGGIDPAIANEIESKLNKLPDSVEYLGLVFGSDKKELLNWGNVFVFPTYYSMEGQPISIFEAYASGNVILTTKHAGIPDVFKEEINGFYIEKKSSSSIANRLQLMSENMNEHKNISNHNIKEAAEKYRVENFINKLYNILNE